MLSWGVMGVWINGWGVKQYPGTPIMYLHILETHLIRVNWINNQSGLCVFFFITLNVLLTTDIYCSDLNYKHDVSRLNKDAW